MIIQNNLSATNAKNKLGKNVTGVKKSSEKLSSGFRINRAGDDVAGLAVSEKMRTQLRGVGQAIRNTNDGISFIQTAEGALEETHTLLKRLKELTTQSATGTYTNDDRSFMQAEVDAIKTEIDRIAEATDFNGIRMLNGSMRNTGSSPFIVPMSASDDSGEIVYSSHGVTPVSPSGTAPAIEWAAHPLMGNQNLTPLLTYIESSAVPRAVNAIMSTLPVFGYFSDSNIRMGVEIGNLGGASMAVHMGWGGNQLSVTLLLDRAYLTGLLDTSQPNQINPARLAEFDAVIAHEMMHAFMAVATNTGMTSTSDSFPMWFIEGTAQAAGGAGSGNWLSAGLGLNASSTHSQIQTALSTHNLSGNSGHVQYGTGYLAVMYLGHLAGSGNVAAGLNKILGQIMLGSSLNDVIAENTHFSGLANFQNNFATDSGAHAFISGVLTAMGTTGEGSILATGGLGASNPLASRPTTPHTFLNIDPNQSARVANAYAPGYNRASGGGRMSSGNPVHADMPTHTAFAGIAPASDGGGDPTDPGVSVTVVLGDGLTLQIGDRNGIHTRMNVIIENMTTTGLLINNLDISTQGDAIAALGRLGGDGDSEVLAIDNASNEGTVDHAVFLVSRQRANLGALQNRLEHTANSLTITHENITASESQIRDTDMASEMMRYTKYNILQQAAQAMLAQANQAPQAVLQLLR
jgi:flagellin